MRRWAFSLFLAPVAFIGLALLATAVGWIVVYTVQPLELDGVRWVAAHRTPGLTFVMHRFSDLAGEMEVIIVVGVSAAIFLLVRHLRDALVVIGSAVGMLFLYETVARWVGRPRPPVQHLENPGGSSFPSGHVANSTAVYVAILLAVFLLTHVRALRPALIGLAAVLIAGIAASRVYLGLHYPTDVVTGFLLGLGWAVAVRKTVDGVAPPTRPLGAHP